MVRADWLVMGASGFFGSYLCRALHARSLSMIGQSNSHDAAFDGVAADLASPGSGYQLVKRHQPSIVVNCAALANVDQCEREPALAKRLNTDLCGELAAACSEVGATFVAISTDQLWRNEPPMIREDAPVDPIGVYGATKAGGEAQARRTDRHLILRTNFFGRGLAWRQSLSDQILSSLDAGRGFNGFSDVFYTPIAVGLAVEWLIDAVEAGLRGTYHLAGRDRLSKYDFAAAFAKAAGRDPAAVKRGRLADAKLTTPRPCEMSLNCEKLSAALGRPVPGISQSIENALLA